MCISTIYFMIQWIIIGLIYNRKSHLFLIDPTCISVYIFDISTRGCHIYLRFFNIEYFHLYTPYIVQSMSTIRAHVKMTPFVTIFITWIRCGPLILNNLSSSIFVSNYQFLLLFLVRRIWSSIISIGSNSIEKDQYLQ